MATTSPDNLRTPNPGDSYNLVPDLATLANDVQAALLTRSARFDTAAQRAAFLSTAPVGFLWQDTDGIGMIWKKAGAVWVPAVWRWAGTTAQMNAFTQAPNGFEWFNTTDNSEYVRLSGAWGRATPDSGWVDISSSINATYRGAAEARKLGGIVEVRYSSLAKSIPAGVTQVGVIPLQFRPTGTPLDLSSRGAVYLDGATTSGTSQLNPAGELTMVNPSGASRSYAATSFTFVA